MKSGLLRNLQNYLSAMISSVNLMSNIKLWIAIIYRFAFHLQKSIRSCHKNGLWKMIIIQVFKSFQI